MNSYISHPAIDAPLYDYLVLDVNLHGYVLRGVEPEFHNYPNVVDLANSGEFFYGKIADHSFHFKFFDVTCVGHPNRCLKGMLLILYVLYLFCLFCCFRFVFYLFVCV